MNFENDQEQPLPLTPSPQAERGDSLPQPRRGWLRVLMIVGVVGILFALGGGATISVLEERDTFCASCHMAPERTYYNRAQFAIAGEGPLSDLASSHYTIEADELPHNTEFRCIDCHRGDEGFGHRATAIMLGGRDSLIYVFGEPDQTIEKTEIQAPVLLTDSCLKCHTETLLEVGFGNHFHNKLELAYEAWMDGGELFAPDGDVETYAIALEEGLEPVEINILCVDCHLAHINTPGSELSGFIDLDAVVYPTCEDCHIEALGAALGLVDLEE